MGSDCRQVGPLRGGGAAASKVNAARWCAACAGFILAAACAGDREGSANDNDGAASVAGGGTTATAGSRGGDGGTRPGGEPEAGSRGTDPEVGGTARGGTEGSAEAGAAAGPTGADGGVGVVEPILGGAGGATGMGGPGGGANELGAAGMAAGEGGEGGVAWGSIQVSDFEDYQVVQRTLGGSSQRVRVLGSFSGPSITSVQGQVVSFVADDRVIVPWTDLPVTSNNVYAGSLTVPQGGWYRILVRGRTQLGSEVARATGAHRWGVGMNILCVGQSNMVGYGGNSYTSAGDLVALHGNDGAWKHLADPYDRGGALSDVDYDAGPGASLVPALANALSGYFPGLPIGILPAAKGSSPLVCKDETPCWGRRNDAKPADTSTLYGNSVAKAQGVNGVELVVMHQGETDATNATSTEMYASALSLLAGNYRKDLGDVPLFMCQLGRSTTDIAAKGRTDVTMQAIRTAQHDADAPPKVYLAATAIDLDVDATDHYKKGALDELGRRIAGAIAYRYQVASAPTAYRGPQIGSVAYTDPSRTSIDVHLTHRGGKDFSPPTGINGFVVLDGATPLSLTAARLNASTIRLVLKQAIRGVGSVRYLYGKLPSQTLPNTVHDDSSLALPLEPTTTDWLLP